MAIQSLGNGFSRKDYLSLHREISTATASRDLAQAVESGELKRVGEKALAIYQKTSKA